jgi:hypothetical protein
MTTRPGRTAVGVLGWAGTVVGLFILRRAWPLVPQWTISGVRDDIETIRKGVHP